MVIAYAEHNQKVTSHCPIRLAANC